MRRESLETHSLCSGRALLFTVLLSFLLAFLLTLAGLRNLQDFWRLLGLNSLFVVWAGLLTLLLLCTLDRRLVQWSMLRVGLLTIAFVQILVGLLSLLIVWFVDLLSAGDFLARYSPRLFVGRNLGIALIVSLVISRYLVLQEHWKRQLLAESEARLDALQSRIRPHFLFNTLNTISSLIPDQPEQAEQATMDLADLLRTGLKDESSHSLADELELVRGYLRIESLRLGERLQVEWALADELPLDKPVPALLLQPLVENAVIHGIAARPDGGLLVIRGELLRFDRLRFVVENPLASENTPNSKGNQLALDNIRQRLTLSFEQGAGLKTERENALFRVTLTIPVKA